MTTTEEVPNRFQNLDSKIRGEQPECTLLHEDCENSKFSKTQNLKDEGYNFYVTTPIYYVNAKPHIGTAYTSFVADTLSRYMRLDGREVYFMTGTDEHGQKVAESAKAAGITPQDFCDQMSKHFSDMGDAFGFTNDVFSRTTNPSHKEGAIAFWNKLVENGYIYKGSYAGWYAVRDECFYGEDELVDGKAPTGADVAWVEEPSYFFKLSAFQDKLLKFYEENPHCVLPKARLNEVKRFVEGGLRDLSVSRSSFKWGIPVPGDPEHVMYVWVEALPVYLTSIGYPQTEDPLFKKNWAKSLHLVGKDILRFHAVYWPALLMAADLTPPQTVFAHGWWTNDGQKISKSLGNVIDPFELVEQFGRDAVRFFLMREVPLGQDGDFSRKALIQRTNSDLANAYGNLVQRVLSFIYKNADGTLAGLDNLLPQDQELLTHAQNLYGDIQKDMETYQVHKVLESIWQVIIAANKYVDEQAPWSLRKTDTNRMNQVLAVLVDVIRRVTIFTQPFVPNAATKILDTLNMDPSARTFKDLDNTLPAGHKIQEPQGAFPRIAEEA